MIRATLNVLVVTACLGGTMASTGGPGDHPAGGEGLEPAGTGVPDVRITAQAVAASKVATIVDLDLDRLRDAARGQRVKVESVALPGGGAVVLSLERFAVTTPRTKFVVGTPGGGFYERGFDADSIVLLRGEVAGAPDSHVYLALSDELSVGRIELPGGETLAVSSGLGDAAEEAPGRISITKRDLSPGRPPTVQPCVVLDGGGGAPAARVAQGRQSRSGSDEAGGGLPASIGRRWIDVAVETDYELLVTVGSDLDAGNTYLIMLWGAISDIYLRDVNVGVNLKWVRLWDSPADMFNEPDPLVPFRDWWNANMGHEERDAAQFCSGRRDLPYGGVAWLSALCGDNGYSVAGYLVGFLPEPETPSLTGYDIQVCAHELGHNAGTLHTHNYGVDDCDNFDGTPVRGTIMSYCSQTMSGGNELTDLRFHSVPVAEMREHIDTRACLIDDCNGNDVDDADDILLGTSADVNADGIPDDCQDCNNNSVLDPDDISAQTSDDVNGNGIPDECEPDCNGNGIPDSWDISQGTSDDLYGNAIPDECETDCNANGTSDYSEIQADMTLDLDRNAELDDCQDCDTDGTNDIEALDGSHGLWTTSLSALYLSEFHANAGVRMSGFDDGLVNLGHDLIITDDRRILISSSGDDRIVEFDADGNLVDDLVTAGSGGLDGPGSMLITDGGTLLVASTLTNSVLEYNLTTGAFIGAFVSSGAGGLSGPFGLAYGPNGNLFVSTDDDQVLEFDGGSGAFVQVFVDALDNGGPSMPRQLLFLPNGNLLVASMGTNELLHYDGTTGDPLGKWNLGGTDAALTFDAPWGLRVGPSGHLYASRSGAVAADLHDPLPDDYIIQELHINSTRVYEFDIDSGHFLRSFIVGNDTGLDMPTGFDFMPDDGTDCNFNLLPDSCDITSGFSDDVNQNGVPDECECISDTDGNGAVDVVDLLAVLANWGACPGCPADINADDQVDVLDLLAVLGAWGSCVQ